MARYDLQILNSDGSAFVIPNVEPNEVVDFIEYYDEAESFMVLPIEPSASDPDGGLPLEQRLAA